ncbi:MAG: hypothetical protein R3D27_13985 [Hyphomicrobiaceae bacterium]
MLKRSVFGHIVTLGLLAVGAIGVISLLLSAVSLLIYRSPSALFSENRYLGPVASAAAVIAIAYAYRIDQGVGRGWDDQVRGAARSALLAASAWDVLAFAGLSFVFLVVVLRFVLATIGLQPYMHPETEIPETLMAGVAGLGVLVSSALFMVSLKLMGRYVEQRSVN